MAGAIEFTCSWEAWYAGVVPDREVNLQAPTTDLDGQPVDAYATFVEHKVGAHTAVRLEVWSDGWRILRDPPVAVHPHHRPSRAGCDARGGRRPAGRVRLHRRHPARHPCPALPVALRGRHPSPEEGLILMPKKTPAADQFAALGLAESDYTKAMQLAVKQRWSDLPVDDKVADLRARLAGLAVADVVLEDVLAAAGADPLSPTADQLEAARTEQARLKRNAAVNAWRERNKIQAALDARDLKFAALRAKRGKSAPAREGTETGDVAVAS